MPSLQQLRWEAFADAVEKVIYPRVFGLATTMPMEHLDVRVELEEGVALEFRLFRVDLDGRELIGRSMSTGASVNLPLTRVKAVWRIKRRTGRAMLVWFAGFLACAAGGALVAVATKRGDPGVGALLGALVGTIAGIKVLLRFDRWSALYKRIPMYDSTEPS